MQLMIIQLQRTNSSFEEIFVKFRGLKNIFNPLTFKENIQMHADKDLHMSREARDHILQQT